MECEGGGFNLAAMQMGKYINVVPFLNGGNVHKFLAKVFSREEEKAPDYAYISELLKESRPGSGGVFFLPYLTGERFPVMDGDIRGCYLGLGQETGAADMARSALEGAAYSIRQGLELFSDPAERITLIGGGAREAAWCRILSSIMGKEIYVYQNPDLLPALAIASAVFLAEGMIRDYKDFIKSLESRGYCTVCEPEPGTKELYDGLYEKYKRIYPMVKEFYRRNDR
jgi:xylulokinase